MRSGRLRYWRRLRRRTGHLLWRSRFGLGRGANRFMERNISMNETETAKGAQPGNGPEGNGTGVSLEGTTESGFPLARTIAHLRFLWGHRGLLFRAFLLALVGCTRIAFLIPARYDATTQLMPPDNQSAPGMALLSAVTARAGRDGDPVGRAGALLGQRHSEPH